MDLKESASLGTSLISTETNRTNGMIYHYILYAVNAIESCPLSTIVRVTPLAPLGPLNLLKEKLEGDTIVMAWAASAEYSKQHWLW